MKISPDFYNQVSQFDAEQVAQALHTSTGLGLTQIQAQERLREYGPNQVPQKQQHWWNTLWDQFQSPFIYLLLIVCVLMVTLGDTTNALITLAIIALNTFVGFFQEYKASQALQALKQLIVARASVIRDGIEHEIPAADLVPGDLIVLYPGDIVPADGRIIWHENCVVDESTLTGESIPVSKTDKTIDAKNSASKNGNQVFNGTTIISGKAKALVIKTGFRTSLGEIVHLVTQEVPPSPFAQSITTISRFMVYVTVATVAMLIILHLIIARGHLDMFELIIFAAALGVSVIPEALPVVTTFCLTRGASTLARHKVVVKRLSAIQDLGSMQVLCTDKTGTLTENKLAVVATLGFVEELLLYATLGSGLSSRALSLAKGFDAALYNALSVAERLRIDSYTKVSEIPFDPERRRSLVISRGPSEQFMIVRGAPESILPLCTITEEEKKNAMQWLDQQGIMGHRVLAIAKKEVSNDATQSIRDQENNLTLRGLIAFEDPLKTTAHDAVVHAKKRGIIIKILSGDSAAVCAAVGVKVGIINAPDQVLLGESFARMSASEKEKASFECHVFARVTPAQKYEIIKLLQQRYQVGYMGDGINDAPALRIAHVALAVDDATDVARDAADVILLDKSLAVIVDGIGLGRATFVNTMKYLKITLAGNLGNFYAVGISSLFIDFVPMLPTQLLLVNFLSDIPLIALSTDHVDERELDRPSRFALRDIALITIILGLISTMFDFIIFWWFFRMAPAVLQTNWFIASLWTELAFLFSVRTPHFIFKGTTPSLALIMLSLLMGALSIILPFSSLGQNYFHFIPPTAEHLMIIAAIVLLYMVVTEIVKVTYYQIMNNNRKT